MLKSDFFITYNSSVQNKGSSGENIKKVIECYDFIANFSSDMGMKDSACQLGWGFHTLPF